MFNVYGDDIILENVKVGELKGGWPTLRDRAVDYLEGTIDGYVEEGEHCVLVEEAAEKGYKDGQADKEDELRPLVAREIEAAFQRGIKAGYAQAKQDLKVAR